MNILGLGTFEIIVVLVVAFIFLGPERMVDAARMLGRVVREVRRMSAQLPEIDLESEELVRPRGPVVHRGGGPGGGAEDGPAGVEIEPASQATEEGKAVEDGAARATDGSSSDGPVPFDGVGRGASSQTVEARGGEAEEPRERETS